MTDQNATSSGTVAAPVPGDASTPATAIDSPLALPAPGTSVDIESLMAGPEVQETLGTETQSEAGGDVTKVDTAKADKTEDAPDTTTTTTDTETEADPEEQEEADALKQAADDKVPKWVHPRLSKMAEQKAKLREQLSELQSQLKAREEAEAEAAANPSTPLPAGAIAQLDTEEKLTDAVNTAVNNLKWAEHRTDFEKYFTDDSEEVPEASRKTAEEKFQKFRANQLFILANQEAQRKLLADRKAALEDVRKSVPAMFKPGTEEHAFYQKALKIDLRTDPEFHQLMADAIRGRKARLELAKATAAKVPVKKEVAKVPPIPVPSVATARASVRTEDAPDRRTQVWQDAKAQKPVSVDDMMDAGALAA